MPGSHSSQRPAVCPSETVWNRRGTFYCRVVSWFANSVARLQSGKFWGGMNLLSSNTARRICAKPTQQLFWVHPLCTRSPLPWSTWSSAYRVHQKQLSHQLHRLVLEARGFIVPHVLIFTEIPNRKSQKRWPEFAKFRHFLLLWWSDNANPFCNLEW